MTVRAVDFENFTNLLSEKTYRKRGRPLSEVTMRGDRFKLAQQARLIEADSIEAFGTAMGDEAAVNELLKALESSNSPGSVRSHMAPLRHFVAYSQAQGWLDASPLLDVELPPDNGRKPIVVYRDEDIETILGGAKSQGARWWAFLTFVADTGRRVGETLNLEWGWFRLDGETPYVELPFTKNGKPQYIPLGERLVERAFAPGHIEKMRTEHLDQRLQRDPQVYPFPWSYQASLERFRRLCRRVDVESRGFHCFRHTRATALLAAGAPLPAVSALLGHANIATTDRIYNHTTALSYKDWVK